jgi:hypothetical protein
MEHVACVVWTLSAEFKSEDNGIIHVAELGMSGRMILKWFLKKYVVM